MSPRDPIDSPAELRQVPRHELSEVADDLRKEVIELVSKTGGHLAAGLGAVELATVLHYVFDTPRDKIIWDVGHQGYPHKLLTGRRSSFLSIGQLGGIGKFPFTIHWPYPARVCLSCRHSFPASRPYRLIRLFPW